MKVKLLSPSVIMRIIWLMPLFISSCEFNITDSPGPQMSSSIEVSKKHKAFLCAYQVKGRKINGVAIDTVFAERKYSLDIGFFSKFHVSDTQSKLIIVSKGDFATQYAGYGIDWELEDFKSKASSIIYKDHQGSSFLDSIPLSVVSIKDKRIIENVTLYKVK